MAGGAASPVVHVLNGPELGLLGTREPAIHGATTLADVEDRCRVVARDHGLGLDFRQSDHEDVLVAWLHEVGDDVVAGRSVGAVLNPGDLPVASLAVRDAILDAAVPVLEVHLSLGPGRGDVRRPSSVAPVVRGVVAGLGPLGYELAIHALGGESRCVVPSPPSA